MQPERKWLIDALTHRPLPALAKYQIAELIETAENEGVLLLLENRLQSHPEKNTLSDEFKFALVVAARPILYGQMQMLAEQRKVLEVLQKAQVDFLVMKGGALAHWLYDQPQLRIVTDLDILLANKQCVLQIHEVLLEAGYIIKSSSVISYEISYRKEGGPYGNYCIDAHWQLFNRALLSELFTFNELQKTSICLPKLKSAKGFSAVYALINACGHRALSLPHRHLVGIQRPDCIRWLWDIHLLAQKLDKAQWQNLLEISKNKKISAIIFEALSKVQTEFGTQFPIDYLAQLENQQNNEPMTMLWFSSMKQYQWHEFLASSPLWSGRFKWLRERIWPNPEAVRERYGGNDPVWKFMLKRLGAGIRRLFG